MKPQFPEIVIRLEDFTHDLKYNIVKALGGINRVMREGGAETADRNVFLDEARDSTDVVDTLKRWVNLQ